MINLTQTERLVRKIAEVVAHPASDTQAAKLAQDYADLCRDANRRLEQCAVMIEAGQFVQALQLAETPPPLLDLITLLSFRQAAEWRTYCQGHQLPWTEPFYDKYVRLLNSTYNKGIAEADEDNPLKKAYRRARMNNDDNEAFSVLRVNARLHPSDKETKKELEQMEKKLLRGRLEQLRQTLDKGDTAGALALLAQLETSGLPIPSSHPVWQQAQVARCQQLLRAAEQLRRQEVWQEAESLVEEIHSLATQYNVQLPAADADSWAALDAWTAEKRAAYAEDQDFQRALSALEYEVQTLESKQTAGARPGAAEAAGLCNSLAAKWREAERFNRPLDEALTGRCEQANSWLQQRVKAAATKKRTTAIAITVLVLGAIGAAIPFALDWFHERDLLRQLAPLESARRVSDTEAFLAGIPPRLRTKSPLAEGVAKAQTFLAHEKELKRTFDENLSWLQQLAAAGFSTNADSANAAKTTARREECGSAEDKLAPEFQPPATSNLLVWDGQWQSFRLSAFSNLVHETTNLADITSRIATNSSPANQTNAAQTALEPRIMQLSSNMVNAEQIAALLRGNDYEAIHATLPGLQRALNDMASLMSGLPLDTNLQGRFLDVSNQFAIWKGETEQWEQAQASLLGAQSLDDCLKSVDRLAQSRFASAAQRDAAAEMDRLNLDMASFLGELLLPNDRARWGSLTNAAAWRTNFMPETPADLEKTLYFKLRDDKYVQNVYAYHLVAFPRTNNPLHSHNIFVQGSMTSDRKTGRTTGLVYDPSLSANSLNFVQTTYDDLSYSEVKKLFRLLECDTFERLGLAELIDPNSGKYQKPILEVLDQLNRETNSSGIFRAFVTMKLCALAAQRPEQWGLQWSPACALHLKALKEIVPEDLKSGDWMVPAQIAKYEAKLTNYFARESGIHLENQAQFLQQLLRETCVEGFALAGFVDSDGHPVLRQTNAPPQEYWGWGGRPPSALLLFRKTAAGSPPVKIAEPLPFTPLFTFRGDRRNLLLKSEQDASFTPSQAAPILPPFFASP
jgi:hypothetical protein